MSSIDLSTIRVLMVEDEAFMAGIISRTLREIGVKIFYDTRSGSEALKVLKDKEIDVVLLDLNMPNISGADLLKFIRNAPEFPNPNLPVIVLTGNSEAETVKSILSMNVSGYLVKPVSKKDLMLRLVKAVSSPAPSNRPN